MSAVVETAGLSKSYGPVPALTDLTLSINAGEVYGLVGRNGAGKTTLMRILVGLLRPGAGSARVFGLPAGDLAAAGRIGSLIESPALYPHLTGRDNLRLLGYYCCAGDDQVDAVLDRVDLTERAGAKFGGYSLGMKQRLGVAAALLGEPELLILDEPANGLDPGAMAQLRDLLRELRAQGRTVLLSSHLLGEVALVCDRVGIVHEGRLITEGTVAEIQARTGDPAVLRLRAEPLRDAIALARELAGVASVTADGDVLEVVLSTATSVQLNRALVTAGVEVYELTVNRQTLEDAFLGLTANDPQDPRPDGSPSARARVRS